jgi:hypothetical protein
MTAGRAATSQLTATGNIDGVITVIPNDGPEAASSDLAEGSVFHARYTVERKLGAGAMGVVYLATDKVTGRKVALKLINPALVRSEAAQQRFMREGLIARDVRHRNIIAVYDLSVAGGQAYLVMEYLPGKTLREFLKSYAEQGVDFETARKIVGNILEGLGAAHATNIVHRDLKPENIMLTGDPNQGDCSLKILDFGIARAIGDNVGKHLTTTSSSTGTPLYMAPEQKTAADTVGPAADLYAVTVILYELLMGVTSGGRWTAVSKERPELPAALDSVIEKGLSNRPRSRYQTAEEYLKVLNQVTIGPPPKPPQPDPIEDKKKPAPVINDDASAKKGWFYWNYMTPKQRRAFWAVCIAALVFFGILGYFQGPETGGTGSVETPNISGRWFDEIRGTNAALYVVDIQQNGNAVTGSYYLYAGGSPVGTMSGRMNGSVLDYQWSAITGETGSGRGQLESDGEHMDVQVNGEFHRLHFDHLPGQ